MPPQANTCLPVASEWVSKFILMCDGTLSVQYKHDIHGRAPHRHGVPGLVCNYPGTTPPWFNVASVYPGPGEFVHKFLYKIRPYTIIPNPCPAQGCGCCDGFTLPTTLHATFSGSTGSCTCYNGLTLPLAYTASDDTDFGPNSGQPAWVIDNQTNCGNTGCRYVLYCLSGLWTFFGAADQPAPGAQWSAAPSTQNCTPFNLQFNNIPIASLPCAGTVNVTITT